MKKSVLKILHYLEYQVDNDKCTAEELKSIYEFGTKELEADATIDDLSEFFNQSGSNIRNILSRRYIPKNKKPKRKVYYNFGWFLSVIPDSWKKR